MGRVRSDERRISRRTLQPKPAYTVFLFSTLERLLPSTGDWLLHLEMTSNLLNLLQGLREAFSKYALKSLNNLAGFDSAIRI